jgi:hypothetical protein
MVTSLAISPLQSGLAGVGPVHTHDDELDVLHVTPPGVVPTSDHQHVAVGVAHDLRRHRAEHLAS